jgi:sulfate transport system substrate-binding protein
VSAVVDKRGTRKLATAYLDFLFSPAGQEIIARHHFRPRDAKVLAAQSSRFPAIKTFTVEDRLGGWAKVQSEHFADGGIYDQIVVKR